MSYQFDHIAQVVPSIAEAIAWYVDTIPGTRILHQDATWGAIEAGGARVAFVVRDEHPGHAAWRVPRAELEALATRHGKEIKIHRDATRSFYLEGPGGQAVELISVEGRHGRLCKQVYNGFMNPIAQPTVQRNLR